MPEFSERSPITAVEHAVLLHVERTSDDLSPKSRHHKTQIALEAVSEQVEEASLQILSAPVELVEVGFIQSKHMGKKSIRNLLAAEHVDLDPLLRHLAHFPFDLVAPLSTRVREIIIERAIPVIQPLIL